jgi:protein-disulfide isomerase
VPLFALANAGIQLDGQLVRDAMGSAVTIGIVAGYVLGKPLGIAGAAWFATRGGGRLTVTWPGLVGTASTAGVGFTVSLLIIELAFTGAQLEEAKIGVLAAAVLSPLVALAIFRAISRLPDTVRARQFARTAADLIDLADDVDPARDHIRGRTDAPVTLVEYGDFECPYCGQAEQVVRELLAANDDDLRYVWRHLPLADVHPSAQLAAEAAEAAGAQGEFWAMHDRLLSHQDELGPRALHGHAEAIGLDVERFAAELRARRHAPRVAVDVASADASGVSGTPTFFINGRRHHGVYDVATLTAAVRAARAAVPAPAAAQ